MPWLGANVLGPNCGGGGILKCLFKVVEFLLVLELAHNEVTFVIIYGANLKSVSISNYIHKFYNFFIKSQLFFC